MSEEADVVVAAGDFASVHRGLEEAIAMLAAIDRPTVVVPGNNETEDAIRDACSGWGTATVLHGESVELAGTTFFGLGSGIPITPWDWSFDLSEEDAEERLRACPNDAVMVLHSPPSGHCDVASDGTHLGSQAILRAIEARRSPLAVCGHIHESWGTESRIGETRVVNLGPDGTWLEI
jgi:uncharacterized protein